MTPTEAIEKLRLFVQSSPLDVAEELQPILQALQTLDPLDRLDLSGYEEIDLPPFPAKKGNKNELTEQDVAELLGVSRSSIRRLAGFHSSHPTAHPIPSHCDNPDGWGRAKRRYFLRSEVNAWIKENWKKTS